LLTGCSKITHDVYVVNDAKKVGIVQPGDSAFAAFRFYKFALANEWYDRLPLHPEDWIEIEAIRDDNGNVLNLEQWMQEIQAKADDGYFVVGVADGRLVDGKRRPGHIVVVIPSPDGNLVSG
jgi:hypothetical protein